jgi:hypothetical protein
VPARTGPGTIAATAGAEPGDPAYTLWLLALIGVLIITAIVVTSWRRLPVGPRLPAEPLLARAPPLRCDACGSTRHSVNVGMGTFRCLDCGNRGSFPS